MTKKFIWKHDNIEYTITKSDKPDKKLKGVYINPETGLKNTLYFGATKNKEGRKYQHYYDKTGILDEKLNHYDNVRRKRYRERHKNDKLNEPSSGLLSYNLLW